MRGCMKSKATVRAFELGQEWTRKSAPPSLGFVSSHDKQLIRNNMKAFQLQHGIGSCHSCSTGLCQSVGMDVHAGYLNISIDLASSAVVDQIETSTCVSCARRSLPS